MKRTVNTLRNMIWGIASKTVMLVLPFVMRTILIKILGAQYAGLSSLFTSILQVLNLAELGIGSAITFSMYKPIAQKDETKVCALMKLYKNVYRIIGIIILIVGISLIPFLPNFINGDIPNDINIYYLYTIYLTNAILTYLLFAYKTILINVHQRNDIVSKINLILYILQYLYQIIIVYVARNYYYYVIIIPIITVLNNLIGAYIATKKYPQYTCKGELSKEDKKDIRKRVYGLVVQKLCVTSRNALDSICVSAFIGLSMVTMYNNYYMIMDAIIGFLAIITTSTSASVGDSIATETVNKNYNNMKTFNYLYMRISGWCTICLACLYQPFMSVWLGESFMYNYDTVVLFCIYFYSLKIGDVLSMYSQGAGLWWEGRYRAIIETILNIVLNLVLGRIIGVNGIILATLISLLIVNLGYGSRIVFKYYFKDKNVAEYFKSHCIYAIITIIIAIITINIANLIDINNVLNLILRGLFCIVFPNILYGLFYRKTKIHIESKDFIKSVIKNVPIINKIVFRK